MSMHEIGFVIAAIFLFCWIIFWGWMLDRQEGEGE
jgi:hypothetical protein